MGASLSDYFNTDGSKVPDCVINDYEYRIDGTFYMNLIIGGAKGVGKSTLFKHIQKSSLAVTKAKTDPLFSKVVHFKNPFTGEFVDVIEVSDMNYDLLFVPEDKNKTDTAETYGDDDDRVQAKQPQFVVDVYREKLTTCNCFIYIADPRNKDLFEDFAHQIEYLPRSSTVIVLNNFIDLQESWIYTDDQIKSKCITICEETNKSFEFWNINSCLPQHYGMKELYLILTQPVYQIKMQCLKEMMLKTLHNMEVSHNTIDSVLIKQDYDEFLKNQIRKLQSSESGQSGQSGQTAESSQAGQATDRIHSRDFKTTHGHYIHDHTMNQFTRIQNKDKQSYSTIIRKQLSPNQDRNYLESGSDCDEISPVDEEKNPRKGVSIDPRVLTESLAEFFEDVANDDVVVDRLSKSVESIPIYVGASKEEAEQSIKKEDNTKLIIGTYPEPANAKEVKSEKVTPISDSDVYEDSEIVHTALQFNETKPVAESIESEMGFSK